MNILWRFIDIMVGKGLSIGVLAQFFFYSAITLSPTALPLSVLLASLITFGNLGERYELLAMKTAGISLLRIMRPLTLFCILLASISFYFQNVVCPNVSQKLDALIYSMFHKSPELDIPEGAFYDQIAGYNIYVRHKDVETGALYDMIIYDLSRGFDEIRVIAADSGRLETTADKMHLYLHLYSGEQFENMKEQNMSQRDNPYRREIFSEKHLLIDFNSDFNLVDDNVMSSRADSKNMSQLKHSIDSLSVRQDSMGLGNMNDYKAVALSTFFLTSEDSATISSSPVKSINVDSVFKSASRSQQLAYHNKMKEYVSGQKNDLLFKGNAMAVGDQAIRGHWVQWMKKITLSLSMLLFFFIGAPLGAIIRKGGLGVPAIVSVFTYILYYITSASGEKMFAAGEWSILGCWLSTIILLPFCIFFTISANRDSSVFQMDVYKEFFRFWFGSRIKRNIVPKDVVIEDPDRERCLSLTEGILSLSSSISAEDSLGRLPGYSSLFFKNRRNDRLHLLSDEIERLVEEMANSRDMIELDILNGFPILQVDGTDSPFSKSNFNKVVGILLPLGLLFWIRSWLFSLKLRKQLVNVSVAADKLKSYIEFGKEGLKS